MPNRTTRSVRPRTVWIAVAAVVVVLGIVAAIVVPRVYAAHVDAQASPTPSIGATRAPSTLDPSQLTGNWTVGAGSTAGYRVQEVLNGQHVTVTGRTTKVSGSATIAGSGITAATVTVEVGSIATDSSNRDAYFRDSALDVQAFPTATFTLAAPITDAVPTGGAATTSTVRGTLTLHGVTKQVTATVQAALDGDGADVSGSIPITFSDYGVTAPSLGFVTVQKQGSVEFLVHATPAG